jgi:hypothetical protein
MGPVAKDAECRNHGCPYSVGVASFENSVEKALRNFI